MKCSTAIMALAGIGSVAASADATQTFEITDLTFQAGPNNDTATYALTVTDKTNGAKSKCNFSTTGGTSHCLGAPAIGGFAKRACANAAWSWAVADQSSKSGYNVQLTYKNGASTLTGNLFIKYSQFQCIPQCAGCYTGEYYYHTDSATVTGA